MKNIFLCFFTIMFPVLMFGCATTPTAPAPPKAEEIKPVEETKKEVPPTRQKENKSLNIFAEILDLVESTDDRQSILPEVEELYERLINEYPGVPLAQESYWKLIELNLKDYDPPRIERAYLLHKEFVGKYPESILRAIIEDTLGKGLYRNAEWNKLLELCTPNYKQYIETDKHPRASLMFMYGEANFYLDNIVEAKKAYEIAAELFPKLREGQKAKAMLETLAKKKK